MINITLWLTFFCNALWFTAYLSCLHGQTVEFIPSYQLFHWAILQLKNKLASLCNILRIIWAWGTRGRRRRWCTHPGNFKQMARVIWGHKWLMLLFIVILMWEIYWSFNVLNVDISSVTAFSSVLLCFNFAEWELLCSSLLQADSKWDRLESQWIAQIQINTYL